LESVKANAIELPFPSGCASLEALSRTLRKYDAYGVYLHMTLQLLEQALLNRLNRASIGRQNFTACHGKVMSFC